MRIEDLARRIREAASQNWRRSRAVILDMIERRGGKMISIVSLAGITGEVKSSEYSAAMARVIGFTKVLAKEVASFEINVNSISPGPILMSPMALAPARLVQKLQRLSGLGRLANLNI